jgi:hypothetical protein
MRLIRPLSVLLFLALVPLAACGDDDEALTKAEFIEQGDAICTAGSEEGEDLEDPDPQDAEDLSRFLDEAIDVLDGAREDFEALDPPADGEEVHQLEVDALQESVEVLKEAKAEADDGNATEAARIISEADPEADARAPLQDYGFTVCGA